MPLFRLSLTSHVIFMQPALSSPLPLPLPACLPACLQLPMAYLQLNQANFVWADNVNWNPFLIVSVWVYGCVNVCVYVGMCVCACVLLCIAELPNYDNQNAIQSAACVYVYVWMQVCVYWCVCVCVRQRTTQKIVFPLWFIYRVVPKKEIKLQNKWGFPLSLDFHCLFAPTPPAHHPLSRWKRHYLVSHYNF